MPPGGDEAMERPKSTAWGVYFWPCSVNAGSLPTRGVFSTEEGDADGNEQGPGGVKVEGPNKDIWDGAKLPDEEFAATESEISFGGPGFSCWPPDASEKRGGIKGGLDSWTICLSTNKLGSE